jgi:hypothetical protein
MDSLGINLTLLIGATVPSPAPRKLMEALQNVTVTHSDSDRSGFQMTFQVGRSGLEEINEHSLLLDPRIRPFNRVIFIVTFSGTPHVLMDGVITHYELSPGSNTTGSTFTLTGEDLSAVMDLEEKIADHPGQDEATIVTMILASYARYSIIPDVRSPSSSEMPLPTERIPQQHGTDLSFIREMAGRFGFIFSITPGPEPGRNTAYWGPPVRSGTTQKALSVNMGQSSNVLSVSFQDNWLGPTSVSGRVQDGSTNREFLVAITSGTREPLAAASGLGISPSCTRTTLLEGSGLTTAQAIARAQGMVDASLDNVVTVTGELDALRYGDLLQPRGLVGLRGAGWQHNGHYYVKSVTHTIKKGEYKQQFTLTREGIGSLV